MRRHPPAAAPAASRAIFDRRRSSATSGSAGQAKPRSPLRRRWGIGERRPHDVAVLLTTLQSTAMIDPLTGLPNRRGMEAKFEASMQAGASAAFSVLIAEKPSAAGAIAGRLPYCRSRLTSSGTPPAAIPPKPTAIVVASNVGMLYSATNTRNPMLRIGQTNCSAKLATFRGELLR